MNPWLRAALIGIVVLMGRPVSAKEDLSNEKCLECHGQPTSSRTNEAGQVRSAFVDPAAYALSVHVDQACTDCHDDIQELKHPKQLEKVDCSDCHEDEVKAYAKSAHGAAAARGGKDIAACVDCHGSPHVALAATNAASPSNFRNIPETCATCHARREGAAGDLAHRRGSISNYQHSVHARILHDEGRHAAVCTDCHGAHAIEKGTDPTSPMFWQNIPKTCGACHQEIAETFAASVHGRAVAAGQRDAPVCTDCHGEHTIAGIKEDSSTVSSAHIPETCGQCHSSQRISTRYTLASGVLDTYMQSFHGLASQIGGVAAANCASCHGYHGILPSTDPASSIHRQNLPETCGKCHAGIGTRLAQGDLRIHEPPGPGPGKAPIVNIVSNVYIAMIVIVIGGMFLFNLLDGAHKLRAHIRRVRKDPRSELRMTPVMRAQHGLLIITFVLLAYTGFVHKYPDAAWSWPFQVIENGTYWRGLIHRVAGWVFTGVFAAHLMMLLGTARGRSYLPHLWLCGHDAADALNLLRRNLGLGGPGPRPRQYNFAEKSEYWALVWGSFLMIISGVMLIFTSATLRLLPQVWLEVAQVVHYYEAILATLAIVIWHFYWVIFDPAEYPMNTAWLIGRKKPSHPHHEKLPASDGESPK